MLLEFNNLHPYTLGQSLPLHSSGMSRRMEAATADKDAPEYERCKGAWSLAASLWTGPTDAGRGGTAASSSLTL